MTTLKEGEVSWLQTFILLGLPALITGVAVVVYRVSREAGE